MQTIIANPDDDTPRLVLADYLEENGQEERAEFIRLQIELASFGQSKLKQESIDTYSGRYHRIVERQTGLFSQHWREWFAVGDNLNIISRLSPAFGNFPQIRGDDGELHVRRGFVENIVTTCEKWFQHANSVCAENPVTILGLLDRPDIDFGNVETRTEKYFNRTTVIAKEWVVRVRGVGGPERFAIQRSVSDLDMAMTRENYAIDHMNREVERARTIDGYFANKWPQIKRLSYPADHRLGRVDSVVASKQIRPCRFVSRADGEFGVEEAGVGGFGVVGVSFQGNRAPPGVLNSIFAAEPGESLPIYHEGEVCLLEFGEDVDENSVLTSGHGGVGMKRTEGCASLAVTLERGFAGKLARIRLIDFTIQASQMGREYLSA